MTHDDVDVVVLTGAYETAQLFRSWKPSIRLLAETSGKNALVVTAAADEDAAIRDLIRSAFGHAGQKCSAASLGILEASVYDDPAFLRRLAAAVRSIRVGAADDLATMTGPIVGEPSPKLARALTTLDAGERWLVEPVCVDAARHIWSPGVKLGVRPGSWFHRTECFGPVLGLMRAESLDHAIELQNATDFGLTGGIHSLDDDEVQHWLDRVEVGNAYVNRHITGAVVQRQPFGGWKRSAVGCGPKAGGPAYVEAFGTWSLMAGTTPDGLDEFHRVWTELFSRPLDASGLRSERNTLHHRPLPWVDLVVGTDAAPEAVEIARLAALVAGVPGNVVAARATGRRSSACRRHRERRAVGRVVRRRCGGRSRAARGRRRGRAAPLGARAGRQPHPSPARSFARLIACGDTVCPLWHIALQSSVATGSARRSPQKHSRWSAPRACRSTPSTSTSAAPATCATARSSATPRWPNCATSTPSCSAPSARPAVPPGVIERGLLLKMRFELDLYINQRPFIGTAPGGTEPHDFVVIRENTEGPYVGEGGVLRKGTPHEVATQGSVNTRMGAERAVRYAFELAMTRRKHVTLVHKTNVLTFAGDLWQRAFDDVAAEYPEVSTAYNHVDAACIYFVQDPHRYDVIVTDNLFGDILTDLGGAVSGGIGLASSANLNPARTGPSMFEPVHGSAPDIVGTGKANPTAAVLSRGADARLPRRDSRRRPHPRRLRRACHWHHQRDRFTTRRRRGTLTRPTRTRRTEVLRHHSRTTPLLKGQRCRSRPLPRSG